MLANSPLINTNEAASSSTQSIIEEEKTDSTGQSSLNEKDDGKSPEPALRRTSGKDKLKRKSTNWFTGAVGAIGDAVTDLAVNIKEKTINALDAEAEDDKKVGAATKELTEDEQFVKDLYRRVHTQSRLLQNQMTLNIIMEIKERSRREDEPTEISLRCGKIRKNLVPLKWISLFLLGVIPMFQIPNWCI